VPEFVYKVKKTAKEVLAGTIESENTDQAVAELLRLGLVPLEIVARAEVRGTMPALRAVPRRSKLSVAELNLFTRQFADMLTSGMPEIACLWFACRHCRSPRVSFIIEKIAEMVQEGLPLSSALAEFPESFPPLYIQLVRCGEISGQLGKTFNNLAELLDRELEFRVQVRSALIYPSLIIICGVVTIFVLLAFVIPRMNFLFMEFGQTLPFATRVLLALSDGLSRSGWVLLAAAIAGFYFLRQKKYQHTLSEFWSRTCLRIPFVRGFVREQEYANFFRAMAALLGNGVRMVPALEAGAALMENPVLRQAVIRARALVVEGKDVIGALADGKVFSEEDIGMLAVAQRSGQMAEGFARLAGYHERRTKQQVKIITTLIEPGMILLIGSLVGFVVIALLLPILRMNMLVN